MAEGIQIERSKHAQEFVIIGNSEVRDCRLSFRARGLHHHLLSLPPGWRVTTADLAKDHPEGREAIRTALKELITHGYVTKVKRQGERGRWTTTLTVHDKPQPAESTEDGFPGVGSPVVGQPDFGGLGAKDLKTVTENGEEKEKKATRRAAHFVSGANLDPQSIVDDVRRAVIGTYRGNAADLTDEQCMHIYRRFCCEASGTPYDLTAGVYAYLVGGALKNVPTLKQALEPSRKRRIPMAAIRHFNEETDGSERIELIEELVGGFYPGEEPAVEKMLMDEQPLTYIVNVLDGWHAAAA